jgi:3-hydroxyisobutyrate dehydrogenase-like beta-hydroxyacid dehydrogenase
MAKDLKFVTDTAYDTGASASLAHASLQVYRRAINRGLGDEDFAAVFKALD